MFKFTISPEGTNVQGVVTYTLHVDQVTSPRHSVEISSTYALTLDEATAIVAEYENEN